VFVAIGAVLVAAFVARQSTSAEARRRLLIVAAVAVSVRWLAVTVVYLISIRTHGEGTWLNDEASFYLAAESLLPNPFDKVLPQGLGHLAGNGYLGLLTSISVLLGRMDTVAFRLTNAALGTLVALMASVVTTRLVSARAGLVVGLVVALWPTLVLWSATFLRDTLGSFVVLAVWSTLVFHRQITQPRVVGVLGLALMLLASLRPYLAGAVLTGVVGWAAWPFIASRSKRALALGAAVTLVVCGGLALQQARHIDQAAHELVYRQMTTRMETLGMLYHDLNPNSPPVEQPFGPGAPVAVVDSASGWLLTGLVQEPLGPGKVAVAFTDGSIQTRDIADLVLLQSAPLSPLQIVASLGPGLVSFISGSVGIGDPGSLAWSADALAWDVLFVLALVGGIRARVPFREWLFPACVVLGTVAALVSVPGAPGNDDRHRASQTVPLLAVFAAGLLASRRRPALDPGPADSTATRSPTRAPTAAIS
jgi:hypothetical protein